MSTDPPAGPRRLDTELVRRGLARSREHARELLARGDVSVGAQAVRKPSTRVGATADISCAESAPRYVSRGADKLRGALADFERYGLFVPDRRCLDAGASTGGFTQVLLGGGAAVVVAVDVGTGQLAPELREHPRVLVRERTDIRTLRPADIGGPVELAVADLSFIPLRLVLPALTGLVRPDGDLLVLVKPQFEVGPRRVGRGGVVREASARGDALRGAADAAQLLGLGCAGASVSRCPGASGNLEYFLWLRRDAPGLVGDPFTALAAGSETAAAWCAGELASWPNGVP